MSKEAVNKILNDSSSEQDFRKKVTDLAAAKHGNEAVNSLLESSSSEEDFISKVSDLATEEPVAQETLESKYLEPAIYPAIEKVSKFLEPVGTALKAPMAPFGYLANTASNLIQGKELETEPYILEKPGEWINRYGSASALGRTIDTPSLERPLSEMGWRTSDSDLATQFPKATSAITSMTLKQLGEGVADIALMEGGASALGAISRTKPIQGALTRTAEAVRSASVPYIEKALIRMSKEPIDQIVKMEKYGKYNSMANTISKYGLTRDITSPSKLLTSLESKINDISQNLDFEMSNVVNKADLTRIKKSAIDSLYNKYGGEFSGTSFDLQKVIKEVESIVKGDVSGSEATLNNLIELKRNVADYVYELKRSTPTETVLGASPKAVREAVWKSIDDEINLMAGKDSPFLKTNKDLSDLLEARNGVANANIEKIRSPSLTEMAIGTGAMASVGAATGVNPMFAASVYPTMRYGTKALESGVPSIAAKGLDVASDIIYSPVERGLPLQYSPGKRATGMGAISAGQQLNEQENSRTPQSIPTEMQAKAMQRGLVENLADYEIPRNSQEILANPQMALAKLSQITDNPQIVKGLQDAIEKHPDKLKTILPLMGLQFPNLFVADKYNRFDGKIFDPNPEMKAQLIQRAYKDVELKKDLSNTEKTMLWDGLNRDGSLPDTFQ